jgi:hypothetical protein
MNALNEMLKRVQHDEKKAVIPNLFRTVMGSGLTIDIHFFVIIPINL